MDVTGKVHLERKLMKRYHSYLYRNPERCQISTVILNERLCKWNKTRTNEEYYLSFLLFSWHDLCDLDDNRM